MIALQVSLVICRGRPVLDAGDRRWILRRPVNLEADAARLLARRDSGLTQRSLEGGFLTRKCLRGGKTDDRG